MWALVLLGAALAAGLVWLFAALALPLLIRRVATLLLTRPMSDTLAELYVSTRSTSPIKLLYASLRAATGTTVIRPMGSARPTLGLDNIALVPAQLARRPVLETDPVDITCVIGPRAKRPVHLDMPIYIAGMAYGLALTRSARLALAAGSGRARIALCSGQGPFLAEERELSHRYILQFGRWAWNREPEVLKQADMIEIQVGQGAMPGNAVLSTPDEVGREVLEKMRLQPGEAPTIHANLYLERPDRPSSLAEVVEALRASVPDKPIAVKFGAGQDLEGDLAVAIDAGVDAIVIDGTEGATGNAPITLSDHFGIPTLPALARAVHYLKEQGVRDQVSLLISGGLREPGDFLKAYALGADAVGIATVALFAIAHPQIVRTLPFYPPTDLVFYRAHPAFALDPQSGADALHRFLMSCKAEMEIAIRTLGHHSVRELSPRDLVALEKDVAAWADLPYVGDHPKLPRPDREKNGPRVVGRLPGLGEKAHVRKH